MYVWSNYALKSQFAEKELLNQRDVGLNININI